MKIYQCWVKKLVSKTQWNSWYSKNSSYCFLQEDGDRVCTGFLVGDPDPNYIPLNCFPINNDEARQIDEYRRSKNIRPYVSEDIKPIDKSPEVKQSTLSALDKIRNNLAQKLSVKSSETLEAPVAERRKI